MNKKLLVTIILYYSSFAHSFAFHPDTLSFIHPVVFDHAFSVLESNRIETGILYDYGITPVEFSDYDGSVGNNQKANIYDIYYLLKGISSSIINYNQLPPNASEMVTSMSNSFISTSAIPIGIVLYKYNRFCNDAITSGKLRYYAQNEIVEDVYDPNNNWINPYTDSYVFAFSPYQNIVGQSVSFDFNTIFRFTNQTIVNLQFDSGNGVFQTVGTSPISVNYTSASTKHLRLKATLSDNTVLFAYSDLVVPLVEETTSTSGSSAVLNVETFTSTIPSEGKYPQAVISTRFAGGSTTMTKQPLIVVEGFDPLNYGDGRYVNGFTNITRFENSHNTFLNDYDLVYIDWKQSTASIESNADILKQVIAWVNNRKPNGFRSILIGQSMGGLIARYALKTMENAHIDHQVACFVSDDTPHLGANIPLGLLFTAQHAFESLDDHLISHVISDFIALWDNLFDANNYGTIRSQLRAIRNGESVRQMLYNYVNEDYEIDNTMYNSFQTTLRNLGFPQGDSYGDLRLLSITNGGDNTFTTSSPILDVSMNGDIGFGSRLVFWGLASLLFRTTSLLPFVGPSNSTVEIHAKAYPFTSSGAKVYESSAVYSKHLLWTTLEIPLFSHEHYAGTGLLPIDNAFGSFYSNEPIPDTTFCQPFWFEFELNSDLQRFMFVPSVSSLCYKNGNPLQSTDYTTDFCMTGINMDNIPFEGYRFHQDTATYHTSLSESDLNWVTSIQHLTIQDTILSNHDRQFSINDSAFTPVWSTSNPSIATISSSGIFNPVSFGTIYVFATIDGTRSRLRLKKEVTIPAPPLNGFPTYSLSAYDYTLPDFLDEDTFYVTATPGSTIDPDIAPYVKYCWGRKVGTSTSITWTETTSLGEFVTMGVSEDHVVYFRVRYLNNYSPTYSITCHARPRIAILDSLGNLYTEDMGEVIEQVRSSGGEQFFTYSFLGNEAVFNHDPTLAELCRKMLTFDNFKSCVREMKPWGERETLVIPYSWVDLDGNHGTDFIVFIYRETE